MNERDPNGISPNTPGAKLDAGKNRVGLVLLGFSRALQEVSKVGTYGADKYTDDGWMSVPDGERRYTDAMLRHVLKEGAGERIDADTGLRHAAHAAWNALARLDLMLRDDEGMPMRSTVPVTPPMRSTPFGGPVRPPYRLRFADGTTCVAYISARGWDDAASGEPIFQYVAEYTPIPIPVAPPINNIQYQLFFADGTSCEAVFTRNGWYEYESLAPITRELSHWAPI